MEKNHSKRVLIVDDNNSIRASVAAYLHDKGYAVEEAIDGIQGLEKGLTVAPHIILLDVVMPGLDGFRLCQLLREKGVKAPIIMLTEKAAIEDKITGFAGGADDYLPKPFDIVELELRINALLKRAAEEPVETSADEQIIRHGGLEIDLERYKVTVDGREVSLTPIEFNILKLLATKPGAVYARNDLLNAIWDTSYEGYKRNIDPHVNRLRTKIEANPRKPKYVLTVWGVGYKFNDEL
ncbi:MAG: response regulator transcription factor [Acidobacteria bacterium]|nr:response regulator transcription factor [Acidobacteriota bacterium]